MISGLLLTLDSDPAARARAIGELATDARLSLGAPVGARLPLVAETRSAEEGERLTEELTAIDGVVLVDVVYVAS